ncbi:MAG: type 1 glutamine amidotransferase [Paracoccus sp. (in: a-proteobacteria)]|uniref:type 1 glutamine amidotransferase n=1 Tax=unclassified Paracoccus (in: a-proteobacteria) TaxID=2688777 RepID=UPI000C37CEF5|nr:MULTISPECIES: type 1 glutamine amidotransferase [unclassified Paracoccus (in: a-proteobacteria)]MAN56752.1 glutamine amidotransferase [Paracoccus sp. (in: a-proteobacteria)]MBA48221.1 glutamine amidotransferase [Paracoccus sp. (in: a-proteobacteria)]MCS5602729.1 type 1 glutamine amidotransferase [Paracoccus sp. (in: a-proteobacteria)]HIC67316.1 type 1 glutamine amidotransferase [Paracoccus sp. (in: a-proteobacteria)]|tara:strand:- start:1877 stop:2587 length:711 start_codon:yes stop_codon:yes gene_type:complete
MRIGILQCGQSPAQLKDELGDYPDMFVRLLDGRGFTFRTWHVEGMEFPADVHEAEGWLLTGSRHGAYEDHDFIPPLEDFIRQAHSAGVPMVGICFGHQIIAQALGGKVVKHPDGWAVGAQDYDFGGKPVTLNAWHQDQVVSRPEGAEVAGRSDFCRNAALIYGDRAFTVQAHPEFDDAFVQGLMDTRARGVVPQDLLDRAAARMGQARDASGIADRIEAFFKQPRALARGDERGVA